MKFILSGIFTTESGIILLEFLDNKLVQRKHAEQTPEVNALLKQYVKELDLKFVTTQLLTIDDIMNHISTDYKGLKKVDRYLIYMDCIRNLFFNMTHNLDTSILSHKRFQTTHAQRPQRPQRISRRRAIDEQQR